MGKSIKVFISYNHNSFDAKVVLEICAKLKALGIDHFVDNMLEWGDHIPKRVLYELSCCTHLIVVISPGSEGSNWVPYEIGLAHGMNINVLPYLVHPEGKPFNFLNNMLYATPDNLDQHLLKLAAQNTAQTPHRNPKPYSYGTVKSDAMYMLYGNHTQPLELQCTYRHDEISIPYDILQYYKVIIENKRRTVAQAGGQFFNGPNARLINFSEELNTQGSDGLEKKIVTLNLGPVSWYDYTVLNDTLDFNIAEGISIRQKYASVDTLIENDRDLSWCKLSNIFCTATTPITRDGYGIFQNRNKNSNSTEVAPGTFTCGLAENIHRYLDEAREDMFHRKHPLDTPKGFIEDVDAGEDYRPEDILSPYLTVQRAIWEELSEELVDYIDIRKDIVFLNIGFEYTKFHPLLIGVVNFKLTRDEMQSIIEQSPGKDHSEHCGLEYIPLAQASEEPWRTKLNPSTWVAGGLASLITAINYHRAGKGR